MSIVKVKNLVKKYGDLKAIDRISIDVKEGEIYGLLGPNGAGKTTLINILCDMMKKNEGELVICGEKIEKSFGDVKNNIGLVPQNLAIYEDLTAKENVKFFASLYGLKGTLLKERTEEALEFVSLLDQQSNYPKNFSGGMKRRLNIACAIAHRPKLIIMDEPTVGIDPQSRNHILNSVKKLNKMGSTIIYTTHYMEEVENLCTRIGIIDHGKIIAEGTLEELQSIVTDKKSIVIETGYKKLESSSEIENINGVETVTIDDYKVTIECLKESDCIGGILKVLTDYEIKIRDIRMQGVSLESAFLSLTGRRLRD